MKKLIKRNHKGLSLCEVLVSLTIFALTSLILATMVAATVKTNKSNYLLNKQMEAQSPYAEAEDKTGLADKPVENIQITSDSDARAFDIPIKIWTLGSADDLANYKFFTNE